LGCWGVGVLGCWGVGVLGCCGFVGHYNFNSLDMGSSELASILLSNRRPRPRFHSLEW
jgi:hypothetical protein